MMHQKVRVFAPASVANVNCGFDVLGFAIQGIGDELTIEKISGNHIVFEVENAGVKVSSTPEKNTATVPILAMLEKLQIQQGFKITLHKKMPIGSGLGSSASSAACGAFALNTILGNPFSKNELVAFAMEGEKLASGTAHADNVAPALLGGVCLISNYTPLTVTKIPTDFPLHAVVIHQQVEVKTAEARAILPREILLKTAIRQQAALAGFVAGLYEKDYTLIKHSLVDYIVEPYRKNAIPFFDELKNIAQGQDALGFGISGSGPSVFTLCKTSEEAIKIAEIQAAFLAKNGAKYTIYNSPINNTGAEVLHME